MNILDAQRLEVNNHLFPSNKSKLGQFMTPVVVANFMAEMLSHDVNQFNDVTQEKTLLDCGAGIGTLTIAATNSRLNFGSLELWEIDPIMRGYLEVNLQKLNIPHVLYSEDFIEDAVNKIKESKGTRFTHAILNPPYKKINSNSMHRNLLSSIGIETVNLYTAFLALTIMLMKDGGQIVAIVPRSFCNGKYYKPFREFMLENCSITWLHLFESRVSAFKDDNVLQENIIIKLVKGRNNQKVKMTTSKGIDFDNIKTKIFNSTEIIQLDDMEKYIRFPMDEMMFINNKLFENLLNDIGVQVSTGPIVDFRVKEYLVKDINDADQPMVPIPYPHHFVNGKIEYPKSHKKYPNAIIKIEKLKNSYWVAGFYVLIKRFSAKEERRRISAYLVTPNSFGSNLIAFENGWNVLHFNKSGLNESLARGLTCFLNSTEVDNYFRIFSGHTQVNATDLRNMKFPSRDVLISLGNKFSSEMNQEKIDQLIESQNNVN